MLNIDGRNAGLIMETPIGKIYSYKRKNEQFCAAECLNGSMIIRLKTINEAKKELLFNSGETFPQLRYYRWGDEKPGFVSIWTFFENGESMSFGQMGKSILPKDAIYDCMYA